MKFYFRVVSVHPCLITSDDGIHEVRVTVSTIKQVLYNFQAELSLLSHQQMTWFYVESQRKDLRGMVGWFAEVCIKR